MTDDDGNIMVVENIHVEGVVPGLDKDDVLKRYIAKKKKLDKLEDKMMDDPYKLPLPTIPHKTMAVPLPLLTRAPASRVR